MAEEKQEEDLKVADLVKGFTDKDLNEVSDLFKVFHDLKVRYEEMHDVNDIESLERLKREYIGQLERYSSVYSKVRKFKDSGNVYLGEHRKRFKAEAIAMLKDEGKNSTDSGNLVYSYPYYVRRIELTEKLVYLFTKVETFYKYYNETLRSIVQSISVAKDERNNSNHGG